MDCAGIPLKLLPRTSLSTSPNTLKTFYIMQYSKQQIKHAFNSSVWVINWFLVTICFVGPFASYSIHTFPGTSSFLTERHKSREQRPACWLAPRLSSQQLWDSRSTDLLSHSCLALWRPSISCCDTISWNVNLALKDNMLLKSDKKEKLSWVQTDCLSSRVLKMHSQKYFL